MLNRHIKRYDEAKAQRAEIRQRLRRVYKSLRGVLLSEEDRAKLEEMKNSLEAERDMLNCEITEAAEECIEELRRIDNLRPYPYPFTYPWPEPRPLSPTYGPVICGRDLSPLPDSVREKIETAVKNIVRDEEKETE